MSIFIFPLSRVAILHMFPFQNCRCSDVSFQNCNCSISPVQNYHVLDVSFPELSIIRFIIFRLIFLQSVPVLVHDCPFQKCPFSDVFLPELLFVGFVLSRLSSFRLSLSRIFISIFFLFRIVHLQMSLFNTCIFS